jgi:peptidoglycan/xylan/chitin deacetylase (PgdA/CDA1 family)
LNRTSTASTGVFDLARSWRIVIVALVVASTSLIAACSGTAKISGETVISKWKDGKRAVYLLAFDDNLPSQLENVVPELNRRELPGTFYVVPGSGSWAANEAKWLEASKSRQVVLANHTFTHGGVNNAQELDLELAKCNEVLDRVYANRPQPFLLGFAEPGGVPWTVSSGEQTEALKRYNLVERPPFRGSPMNYTTQEELVASVDSAVSEGGMGHSDMHGVGGDYLTTPIEWFYALLDALEAKRDEVWVTDVVSYSQYLAERLTADVAVVSATASGIRLRLTSDTDPALYNYPLTLTTRVPADWANVVVVQGDTTIDVPVTDGRIKYEALPGPREIHINPK